MPALKAKSSSPLAIIQYTDENGFKFQIHLLKLSLAEIAVTTLFQRMNHINHVQLSNHVTMSKQPNLIINCFL